MSRSPVGQDDVEGALSKHSRFAIVSVVLGLLAVLIPLVLGAVSMAAAAPRPGPVALGTVGPSLGFMVGAVRGVILSLPLALAGFVAGLVAGWRPARSKLYARLGMMVNLSFLVALCLFTFAT
ncbi:hypothetical protein ACQVBX_04585 [Dyella sp. KULCS107]|uniref:hypothetical protein n=1 Tax=unclassified Dyella TaxID=2634549 RepID=UPI003D6E634F